MSAPITLTAAGPPDDRLMIPTPPKPRIPPGTRVRVIQRVRVGHARGRPRSTASSRAKALRPVGGMEMGGKAIYCHQPTLRLRRDDGEVTVVALDEDTEVETVAGA